MLRCYCVPRFSVLAPGHWFGTSRSTTWMPPWSMVHGYHRFINRQRRSSSLKFCSNDFDAPSLLNTRLRYESCSQHSWSSFCLGCLACFGNMETPKAFHACFGPCLDLMWNFWGQDIHTLKLGNAHNQFLMSSRSDRCILFPCFICGLSLLYD